MPILINCKDVVTLLGISARSKVNRKSFKTVLVRCLLWQPYKSKKESMSSSARLF